MSSVVNITQKVDYVILTLNQGKVNTINLALAQELFDIFESIRENDAIRGVILTGKPGCFSAGLDVVQLASPNKDDFKTYWTTILKMQQALLHYPKPFICGISGYAPGGGCILACCADYRTMAIGDNYKIGMHEVGLNLQIPDMWMKLYAYWIGYPKALDAILNSQLFSAGEAVSIGLVNREYPAQFLLDESEKVMSKWLQSHDHILQDSKRLLRQELLEITKIDIEKTVEDITEYWHNPQTNEAIKVFLKRLKKKNN